MRNLDNLICLVTVLALCGCSRISNWLQKQNMAAEAKLAESEVVAPAHPVGVTYEVQSSDATRKQLSIFFNGEGLARVLEASTGRDKKTLVDFKKQEIIRKDFNTNWQEATKIDPYSFPSVLNARDAAQAKAICLGTGAIRGFPYHRWCLRKNANEWEVWTDDRDNFPIYYRSIKNGEVSTWTMVNSWIDGSTYDRPTFFSLQADPPPPEPILTAEEQEQIANNKEKKLRHKTVNRHKHRTSSSSAAG